MIEKYKSFEFDRKVFAEDLKEFKSHSGLTSNELDEMTGVVLFMTYLYTDHGKLPTMRNFLLLCNLMNTDPRKYLIMVSPSK